MIKHHEIEIIYYIEEKAIAQLIIYQYYQHIYEMQSSREGHHILEVYFIFTIYNDEKFTTCYFYLNRNNGFCWLSA